MNFKNRLHVILILASLLILARLFLLSTIFDTTWCEEDARGIAAKHILEGVKTQPVYDYFQAYEGGSVIVSFMAVPFMRMLGVSIFSLQCMPCFIPLPFTAAVFVETHICYIALSFFKGRKA